MDCGDQSGKALSSSSTKVESIWQKELHITTPKHHAGKRHDEGEEVAKKGSAGHATSLAERSSSLKLLGHTIG